MNSAIGMRVGTLAVIGVVSTAAAQDGAPAQAAPEALPAAAPEAALAPTTTSDLTSDEARKVQLGLGAGFAIPMGSASSEYTLSNRVNATIPLQLDLGYRVIPWLVLGVYGGYGLGLKHCPDGTSCSVSQFRLGVAGQYHPLHAQTFDPWLGLGAGYEMLNRATDIGGFKSQQTLSGFEYVNVQIGLDIKAGKVLAVGPFAGFSLGQYSRLHEQDPYSDQTGALASNNQTVHEWLTVGLRGAFKL